MRTVILLPLLAVMLSGCSPCRSVISSETAQDSVKVQVVERTYLVRDTVLLEIPAQVATIVTPDSVSFLENDYAESTARINSDGSLFHDLRTKPQEKPLAFDKPVQQRDSVVYKDRLITKTKTVEVARKLTWWQSTQIYGFWGLIILFLITYTIKRVTTHIREISKK